MPNLHHHPVGLSINLYPLPETYSPVSVFGSEAFGPHCPLYSHQVTPVMSSTYFLMKHTSSTAQIGRRNLSLQARNNPCMSLILPGLCHSLNDMIWHLLCNAQGILKDVLPSTIWFAGIVVYYTVPDVVICCA